MRHKLIFWGCLVIYLFLAFGLKNFPPALNADEAAFGYNAYSLIKTGKDEYGKFLPLRLQSFGDFKLPLYSYLSAPLVGIFDLSEFSTRLLAKIVGLGLILLLYQLSLEFFQNKRVALITLILATVSPWIYIFSNQAHETGLATLFLGISLLFLHRFWQQKSLVDWGWSLLFSSLSLFAYHSAKVIFPFLFLLQIFLFWQNRTVVNRKKIKLAWVLVGFTAVFVFLFAYFEIKTPAARVKNLLLFSHESIDLIVNEAQTEARFSPYGQKAFITLREFLNRYLGYLSFEFLVNSGDDNARFGYPGVSPINYLDYVFFLLGLYFLFSLKKRPLWLILLPLLIFPLAGALTWQENSLSRTHGMILAILPLASYGLYQISKNRRLLLWGFLLISVFFSLSGIYFIQSHYPKRAHVIRSWQAGYKELVNYTKQNYESVNNFYITNKHGQPYIFFLFYLKYPPEKYQPQATISGSDEYGFGSVEKLDKYIFKFATPKLNTKNSYIGYPDDFSKEELSRLKFKDIIIGTETIFKILD